MRCYNCGARLTKQDFCTGCGADVSKYKLITSVSNYYYNMGLEKASVRDLSGAIDCLRQCLKLNKYNIDARNLLGLIYFEIGETVSALGEWVISKNFQSEKNIADDYINDMQSNPGQLESYNQTIRKYNQALAYCYQESQDLAVLQLKKVLSTNPKFLKAHLLLALLYMNGSNWEKARKELIKCSKIDANNTMMLRYMKEVEAALRLEEDGKGFKGRQQKEEVIKYQSGNETIIQPLNAIEQKKGAGWILYLLTGLAAGLAVSWFLILPARMQNVQNRLNEEKKISGEQLSKKEAELSELQQQIEMLEKKNTDLKSQMEVYSGSGGEANQIEKLLSAAYIYMEDPEAIDALTEAMTGIDPAVMELESTSDSIKSIYAKLLETVGDKLAGSCYDEGYKAFREENYTDAIKYLEQAVAYDAENEDALFVLGNAYKEKGNKSSAIDTYKKVVELFPGTEKAAKSESYIEALEAE